MSPAAVVRMNDQIIEPHPSKTRWLDFDTRRLIGTQSRTVPGHGRGPRRRTIHRQIDSFPALWEVTRQMGCDRLTQKENKELSWLSGSRFVAVS